MSVECESSKIVTLSDVCDMIAGYAFKSGDFGNYADKVIKITNIVPPSVNMENLVGVDISKYDRTKLKKYLAHDGDYVFAMTGATIGKIGRLYKGSAYINQRVLLFRNKESINKDFLYYILQQYAFYAYILNHIDSESAQPNISANTVGKYQFCLPSMKQQIKIGTLLRIFDDKIESNKRVNDILQQQAHAIYCELTNGRFNACLGDLITEMPKSKIKVSEAKETMGDYPFFTSGKAVLNYHTALVSGRKIFLNTGGNADVKYYIGEASYSTDTWCIEGKSGLTDFLYLALYDYLPEIEQICFEGSALRHLQKAKLKTLPICIPSIDENMPFFCAIKSIFDRQSANIQENKRLAALRDTLLPKLMRGEIDVSNVQI